LPDAVFASAMTAHGAEINDFCPSAFVQPGPAVVSAGLCAAVVDKASGARFEMQKSTVHRILSSLSQLGYTEQVEPTSCYRATLKLWELGVGIAAEHPVKRAASMFMAALHRATGETVSLTILSGDDVLYLDKILSPRPIRFTTRIGSRVPAPLTAGGKAMLAHAPDARAIARRAALRIKDKRG
jgi:DNA-binding IclR family transcriptional regulator